MLFVKGIELFIENCEARDLSPKTIERYKYCLKKFDVFLSELYNRPVYIDEIKSEDMERFLFQKYNRKEYSSSSRHNVITAFKSMYSYLERKKLCENKGKLIKSEKVETDERETLSEMEFRKILQYVKAATTKAVLYTLYYSGLRISEALKLKLCDVDLEQDVLHVKETKTKVDRTVPINEKLKKLLLDYLANGRIDCRTDNFFSTYPKGQICPQEINEKLRKAKSKAGIEKKITAHTLRHSFSSQLLQRGCDVLTLRTLLGHKNIRTTSIYCHTTIDELQEAVNVL